MTKPEECLKYDRKYIHNRPLNFADLSAAERHSWVDTELRAGDYADAKKLPLEYVLAFGATTHEWCPEYYLYLILLSAHDPAQTAPHITRAVMAVFFILAYGVELATPYVSTSVWLEAMKELPFTPEEIKARGMIEILLKCRGVDLVAPFITDKDTGEIFVEVFGVKSLTLLPDDIANQVKGRLLEAELGL